MRKTLLLFVIVVMALSVQAQMEKNAAGGGVAQAITQMEQQWAASGKASDSSKIAPLLADNFVNMNSDGTYMNKTQTLDRMKADKWETNQVSDIKVTEHGNTAIATGKWQGKGTSGGKAIDAHESWTDTWMKIGGKWQCVASASAPAKM